MRLKDQTAVVTGAAGGLGRAIALSLARRGTHLALADLKDAGLAETAAQAEALGVRVTTHRLDVADAAAVAALPEAVLAAHPGAALLVNNAGVALIGDFEAVSAADFEWLFAINFWGVVRMARAFLPVLRRAEEARIINISSLFGLIAPPGQAAYCASKFAVRGFSEALRHELQGTTVGVSTVYPGGVATRIAADARFSGTPDPAEIARQKERFASLLRMPPDRAAEIIIRSIERRRADHRGFGRWAGSADRARLSGVLLDADPADGAVNHSRPRVGRESAGAAARLAIAAGLRLMYDAGPSARLNRG